MEREEIFDSYKKSLGEKMFKEYYSGWKVGRCGDSRSRQCPLTGIENILDLVQHFADAGVLGCTAFFHQQYDGENVGDDPRIPVVDHLTFLELKSKPPVRTILCSVEIRIKYLFLHSLLNHI